MMYVSGGASFSSAVKCKLGIWIPVELLLKGYGATRGTLFFGYCWELRSPPYQSPGGIIGTMLRGRIPFPITS